MTIEQINELYIQNAYLWSDEDSCQPSASMQEFSRAVMEKWDAIYAVIEAADRWEFDGGGIYGFEKELGQAVRALRDKCATHN